MEEATALQTGEEGSNGGAPAPEGEGVLASSEEASALNGANDGANDVGNVGRCSCDPKTISVRLNSIDTM